MKILITGATGFVGSYMTRCFAAQGHEVVALGRQASPPMILPKGVRWLHGDITRPLPRLDGDVCIHAAGLASDRVSSHDLYEVNTRATARLAVACQGMHMIYISSSSIYGGQQDQPFAESDDGTPPSTDYGASKLAAERSLADSCLRKVTILRPRAVYGMGDRTLLPRLLQLRRGDSMLLLGDMEVLTSLTHIDRLVDVAASALGQQHDYSVYNVADDAPYLLREVVTGLVRAVFPSISRAVTVPVALLRLVAQLPILSMITRQQLLELSSTRVLDLSRLHQDFPFLVSRRLDKAMVVDMAAWVHAVGVDRVLSADRRLPWLTDTHPPM